MDGVGDTAGLEKIFISVKEAWEDDWKEYRINLVSLVTRYFNVEELRSLCFNLNIEEDNLAAEGKEHKVRELVKYLERRGQLHFLTTELKKLRTSVDWPEPPLIMDERWQRVNWKEAALQYSAYIKRECGTMR